MFNEIVNLYDWIIKEFGNVVKFERLWDGYKITFPNGADIVQHSYSYEGLSGCVEPAGMPCAYQPIRIEKAKKIITKNQKNLFETSWQQEAFML